MNIGCEERDAVLLRNHHSVNPMEFLTFDIEEVYQAAKERALDEGAFTPEAWSDVVDQVISDRADTGEVHDDEELSAVKEDLKARFEEFAKEIPEA